MRPLLTARFSSIVTSYLNHLNSLNKYLRFILEFFWNTSISIELVISGRDEKAERAGQATSKTGMQEMCVGGVASLHAHRLITLMIHVQPSLSVPITKAYSAHPTFKTCYRQRIWRNSFTCRHAWLLHFYMLLFSEFVIKNVDFSWRNKVVKVWFQILVTLQVSGTTMHVAIHY